MSIYNKAKSIIDDIEQELRRLKRWQDSPPPDEAFKNMGAFGMNTMAPEQWIQFVLIPSVRRIITEKGEFPSDSLATWAVRNFDGDIDAGNLEKLLIELANLRE